MCKITDQQNHSGRHIDFGVHGYQLFQGPIFYR